MSTHNIGFYGELTNLIFQLSSNTHLVCSFEGTDPAVRFNRKVNSAYLG